MGKKLKSAVLAGGLKVMLLLLAALSSADAGTGTWTPLTNQPGIAVNNCLLLTDGRVICQAGSGRNWIALTPTNTGSYVNGTWAYIAPMQAGYAPLYHSSAVLPDGRVIVMGGEYDCSSGCPSVDEKNGSIYSPFTNTWTAMTAPAGWTTIGDAMGIVLADALEAEAPAFAGSTARSGFDEEDWPIGEWGLSCILNILSVRFGAALMRNRAWRLRRVAT